MNIEYYNEFVTLAEIKNYQIAAEMLFISQSTLSRHIQAMEEELHIQLFDRSSKDTSLTDAGQLLISYAQEISSEYEECMTYIKDIKVQKTMTLSIGSQILTPEEYGFGSLINSFQKKYPQFNINEVENIVDESRIDQFDLIFIRTLADKAMIGQNHLRMYEDSIIVILPKNHRLAKRKIIKLEELRNENFIFTPDGTWLNSVSKELCKRAGFIPKSKYKGYQGINLIDLVRKGQGVSLMMKKPAVYHYSKEVAIVNMDIDLPVYIDMVWNKKPKTQAKSCFVAFTKMYLEGTNNAE